jgi:hypothetical protein
VARTARIGPDQASELKALIQVSEEQLEALTRLVGQMDSTVAPSLLLEKFSEGLGSHPAARSIIRQLLFIAEYSRLRRVSAKDSFDAVINGLKSHPTWSEEELRLLAKVESWVVKMVEAKVIYGPAKALSLSYDTDGSFIDFRVVTDIRPVFDKERGGVLGGVVINTLKIEFYQHGEQRSISIGADAEELRTIISVVEDAITKSTKAMSWLSDRATPAFVRGDEEYELEC